MDKQTSKYTYAITKEVVYTKESFKERSTRMVGYKDEYKATSTYTEHQLKVRIRKVDYGGSDNNKKGDYKRKENTVVLSLL
ncbi:hypothetical protein REPUB_Repub19eG0073600 [Reevesia pubescens]